jgi:hypothetical protein
MAITGMNNPAGWPNERVPVPELLGVEKMADSLTGDVS